MKSKQWIESEWNFEADIEPFQKGVYSGPPENCFPDEGGYAVITEATLGKITFSREALVDMLTENTVQSIEEEIYEEDAGA